MVMPPPLLEGVPPSLRTPLVARPPLLPGLPLVMPPPLLQGLSTHPQLRWPAAILQRVHL
jgi:hypothetical protein